MSDKSHGVASTSAGRRFAAEFIGTVVFIIGIVLATVIIARWLGTGSQNLAATGLCWIVAGFLSALLGGLCADAIAPDALAKPSFFYILLGVLVVLAILNAIGNNGMGSNFGAWLNSVCMVIGGYIGVKNVVRHG